MTDLSLHDVYLELTGDAYGDTVRVVEALGHTSTTSVSYTVNTRCEIGWKAAAKRLRALADAMYTPQTQGVVVSYQAQLQQNDIWRVRESTTDPDRVPEMLQYYRDRDPEHPVRLVIATTTLVLADPETLEPLED